jgi:hypothetical protein
MLRSEKSLHQYKVRATDGEIGKVHALLFDDQAWIVRYFVVDTGSWLPGRKVLIPPREVKEPEWQDGHLPVKLTRTQVEESPPIDADKPVSRQHEEALHEHFHWHPYWLGGVAIGTTAAQRKEKRQTDPAVETDDPNLRSTREVVGYGVNATDGEIGHIHDFIVDDQDWQMRYAVVDTRTWLPGRKVLLALSWIQRFDWAQRLADIDLSRDQVQNSPEYDPDQPVNRRYEKVLYDYYGRPHDWQ